MASGPKLTQAVVGRRAGPGARPRATPWRSVGFLDLGLHRIFRGGEDTMPGPRAAIVTLAREVRDKLVATVRASTSRPLRWEPWEGSQSLPRWYAASKARRSPRERCIACSHCPAGGAGLGRCPECQASAGHCLDGAEVARSLCHLGTRWTSRSPAQRPALSFRWSCPLSVVQPGLSAGARRFVPQPLDRRRVATGVACGRCGLEYQRRQCGPSARPG